ncbi:LOW QUALITY PROTEIN: hypothetical protein V1477_016844 [Vespula maculifrons]|uniref:Uncharacterized protein n=1 Tax=Vespula maculifrons TaxID=7453 RepID=A0ABD2B4D8_VESMC
MKSTSKLVEILFSDALTLIPAKISKSTPGERLSKSSTVRKFLSPLAEIDFQSPPRVRKFLSPFLEIDRQSSRDAKISKSTRGDRFSKSPRMRKFLSPFLEIDCQSPRERENF